MIPNTNDGTINPPRLRIDINGANIFGLPPSSTAPTGDPRAVLRSASTAYLVARDEAELHARIDRLRSLMPALIGLDRTSVLAALRGWNWRVGTPDGDHQDRVYLTARPDQIVPVVCGGLGSLHAIALPSFGESAMQSVATRVGGGS